MKALAVRCFLALALILPVGAPAQTTVAPRTPEVPSEPGPWGTNPVDRFLHGYFQQQGIAPPEIVSDAAFARRAYLDVWGLLPTPEQLEAFLTDIRPDKRARLVDHLLADSRNYAGHWVSFWNDLLRNDEGVIYHGGRESITSWLVQALEQNLPYDQFVRALLNPTKEGDPKGFLVGVNWRGEVSASQTPVMQAAMNSAQVFLGVNLKCAGCHDSFVSKWKLRETYGLASYFSDEPLELVRCDVNLGEQARIGFLFPELGQTPEGLSLLERRAEAARLFTAEANGRFSRTIVNRIWHRLMGRGLVEPLDEMERRAWHPDLLDSLASSLAGQGYDLKALLRTILTSRTYQLEAVPVPERQQGEFVFRGPYVRRMTAEQFVDGVASLTGEWPVRTAPDSRSLLYSREWRRKSSPLTRALGRPIRDQVFTTRDDQATTLQSLELAAGTSLDDLLTRGARRLLGQVRTPLVSSFDSGLMRSGCLDFEVELDGARELRLLIEDMGSYDPSQVAAGWFDLEVQDSQGWHRVKLPEMPAAGVPSAVTVKLEGDYRRLRGMVAIDHASRRSDINPNVRFFVFTAEPDRDRLLPVTGDRPAPLPPVLKEPGEIISRIYRHAFGRSASDAERSAAAEFLGNQPSPAGVADLLWTVTMSPEFQYIR